MSLEFPVKIILGDKTLGIFALPAAPMVGDTLCFNRVVQDDVVKSRVIVLSRELVSYGELIVHVKWA